MKRIDERLAKADARENIIAIRVTGKEKRELTEIAEKRGTTISGLLRAAIQELELSTAP